MFDLVNRYEVFKDTLMGMATFFTLSTLNQMFMENNDFVRLTGYLWAAPLLYFFFLNMFRSRGLFAIQEFNKHAALGLIITFFVIVITSLLLTKDNLQYAIYANLGVSIFVTCTYLYFKIYKKGFV